LGSEVDKKKKKKLLEVYRYDEMELWV